jgi:hypothetical protein
LGKVEKIHLRVGLQKLQFALGIPPTPNEICCKAKNIHLDKSKARIDLNEFRKDVIHMLPLCFGYNGFLYKVQLARGLQFLSEL